MRFAVVFLISVSFGSISVSPTAMAVSEVVDDFGLKEARSQALIDLESNDQATLQIAIDRQVAQDIKYLEDVIGRTCSDEKQTTPPNSIQLAKQITSVKSVLLDANELALPRGGKLCDEVCVCWVGKATYYGPRFWGRKTSTGQILKKGACTAAVHGFVLPTTLTVRNLSNGKIVKVTANDRIGNARATLIDIEEGCAGKLGIGDPKKRGLDGHAQVEVKYCPN